MTDPRTELAEARAFQLRLAERIAAASEVLSHLAEKKGTGKKMSELPEVSERLIAEAPNLLRIVHNFLYLLPKEDVVPIFHDLIDAAREAVARVEGERL